MNGQNSLMSFPDKARELIASLGYNLGVYLGHGSCGSVYSLLKVYVPVSVIKIISLHANDGSKMEIAEAELLTKFQESDNIVKIFDYFKTEDYLFIIMEYCDMNLSRLNSGYNYLDEKYLLKISYEILLGIKIIHDKEFIHRDIKLSNILLKDGKIKLCDFGLVILNKGGSHLKKRGICGTVKYLAPEVISGEEQKKPGDIWSFGVTIILLSFGNLFNNSDITSSFFLELCNIPFKEIFKNNKIYSENTIELISNIFTNNLDERPTVDDLLLKIENNKLFKEESNFDNLFKSGPILKSPMLIRYNPSIFQDLRDEMSLLFDIDFINEINDPSLLADLTSSFCRNYSPDMISLASGITKVIDSYTPEDDTYSSTSHVSTFESRKY